jgi:lipoprotein-anchoring transpeptidase ErfK/SrfK
LIYPLSSGTINFNMRSNLNRRDFLKLGGLALTSLAVGSAFRPDFPRQPEMDLGKLARVASKQVDVRARPNDTADIVGNRFKDQIIQIYEELHPPDAPRFYNTLWYRVWGGYVHSAHLQEVEIRHNDPVSYIPSAGQLCEVTVPYTTAYQFTKWDGWIPWRGSRLYYTSTHWVTGVEAGPDGKPWYKIVNELSDSEIYFAPAEHLRLFSPQEYAPIAQDILPDKKRIEITLHEQTLRAYENNEIVLTTRISSGIPNSLLSEGQFPTATPPGEYRIYSKMPSKHMGSVAGGDEVEQRGGFTLPGVPWTCFFLSDGGYALHGTYWHNNFGLQMSHGCVNMRNEDALWLFRWSTPVFDPFKIESARNWEKTGNGTLVLVQV